jgi:NADH-quinone oxidoreductase subunit L
MFVGIGVGGYSLGIFHLFTHAFFKALLFLGAGSVIHAMHHEQDMRNMGGLRKDIPFTFWMMTVGTLALTGFPFTAGYYSKDGIIEAAYAASEHSPAAVYGFLATIVAALFTSFYSWRLVFMTFYGERGARSRDIPVAHETTDANAHDEPVAGHDDHARDAHGHGEHVPHESPVVMLIPLALLATGALFAGLVFSGAFIGHGFDEFWKGSLFVSEHNHVLHEMHEIPSMVGYVPTLMMIIGFAVAYYMYIVDKAAPRRLAQANPLLYKFLLNKWYFDELYDFIFVRPAFWLGRLFWKSGDGRIIDGIGPDGVSARVIDAAGRVVKLQTGFVYHYAFAMLIGVAAFITWYLVGGIR